MFWSGNYIAVRELNSLLKEENVTLSQVLEADDILQECKADNKALIQFLTKPEILADLITLITEEPPKNVEVVSQYRHANIACEVLTSHLSMLSDRLSLDTVQMNRLCDFLNKDPPLNPLLASYFSKTVEMLLEKSPKQDWCLHHIVCLRVLDFFKSRRDFLPNLFRHMSTSAIADIFKCLMGIDDLIKTVMEWLEEYQFLECLIQIICCTYVDELPSPSPTSHSDKAHTNHTDDSGGAQGDAENDKSKSDPNGEVGDSIVETSSDSPPDSINDASAAQAEAEAAALKTQLATERIAAAASANAATLLCDLIANGCRLSSVRRATRALRDERGVRVLLQGMFTCGARAQRHALVNGTRVLLALLQHDRAGNVDRSIEEEAQRSHVECDERSVVELAVAPHLPLLHQALLHTHEGVAPGAVGLARVQVAALLAQLALSEVDEVATTMITLGTPGVLVDMFFTYTNNNFLHAHVYTYIKHALNNIAYRTQYAKHLVIECDLLNRLMDLFEENNECVGGRVRGAHMGHAVLCLCVCARVLSTTHTHDTILTSLTLNEQLAQRWDNFVETTLRPIMLHNDTPLGGYYPPENFYEVEVMPETLAANYDFNDMATAGTIEDLTEDANHEGVNEMGGAVGVPRDSAEFIADGLGIEDAEQFAAAKKSFMEMACERFDNDMWEDSGDGDGDDEVPTELMRHVLEQQSPWECAESGGSGGGEGWAQFGGEAAPSPPTPPADQHFAEFTPFWTYDAQTNDGNSTTQLESNLRTMRLEDDMTDKSMDEASSVELANNLLTAMSAMSADAIANIVNANLTPSPPPASGPPTTSAAPPEPQPAPSAEHR